MTSHLRRKISPWHKGASTPVQHTHPSLRLALLFHCVYGSLSSLAQNTLLTLKINTFKQPISI